MAGDEVSVVCLAELLESSDSSDSDFIGEIVKQISKKRNIPKVINFIRDVVETGDDLEVRNYFSSTCLHNRSIS